VKFYRGKGVRNLEPNYKGIYYRKLLAVGDKKLQISALSEEEMWKKYFEMKQKLERGEIVPNKNTTVRQWAERWLEMEKRPAVKKSTYYNIESLVRIEVIDNIGQMQISCVKREDLQKILNGRSGKSFSHLSKMKNYIIEIFNAAERDELIIKNPSRFLNIPEHAEPQSRAMSDEEYAAALKLCDKFINGEDSRLQRIGLWVLIMLRCGLRRGETVPLTWDDIDFNKGLLTINKSVEYVDSKPILNDSAKTSSGNRVIAPPDDVIKALLKFADKGIIFPFSDDGQMMTKQKSWWAWKSFLRELDLSMGAKVYRNKIIETKILPGLKIHSLRHTAITQLVLSGADIKDVQNFAGHANVQTTLNIYTHVSKLDSAMRIKEIQSKQKHND
jgi:integrase